MNRSTIRRLALAASTIVLAASAQLGTGAGAATAAGTTVTGEDISWPNCPKGIGIPQRPTEGQPMPPSNTGFVIVGLTNGPAFTPNPCLRSQVAWARARHVPTAAYAVVTYPTKAQVSRYRTAGPYRAADWRTPLRNAGWAQARYNLDNLRLSGLRTPIIWMDVESYPVAPWSASTAANRAVFEGAKAAYLKAGYRVGIYSTRYQWRAILGPVRYGVPEWRTAGKTSMAAARRMCTTPSIQGGPSVLAQWWTATHDHDLLCASPSRAATMRSFFARG